MMEQPVYVKKDISITLSPVQLAICSVPIVQVVQIVPSVEESYCLLEEYVNANQDNGMILLISTALIVI